MRPKNQRKASSNTKIHAVLSSEINTGLSPIYLFFIQNQATTIVVYSSSLSLPSTIDETFFHFISNIVSIKRRKTQKCVHTVLSLNCFAIVCKSHCGQNTHHNHFCRAFFFAGQISRQEIFSLLVSCHYHHHVQQQRIE